MTRTPQRPFARRRTDGDSRREQRTTRVFEALLVLAGGVTGIWLVVSVLTRAHG